MLDLNYIIKNINSNNKYGEKELALVREHTYKYPYFQIGYTICAKLSKPTTSSIQKAAIYATDRTYLKGLLMNLPPFNSCAIEDNFTDTPKYSYRLENQTLDYNTSTTPITDNTEKNDIEELKSFFFINKYIDDIYKRTPKEILKQKNRTQYAIINKFIKANIKFYPKNIIEQVTDSSYDNLAESSSILNDDLATETLAEILLSQGKIEKALDIYEKIILKDPDKGYALLETIEKLKTD